jgi:hypothetical protein
MEILHRKAEVALFEKSAHFLSSQGESLEHPHMNYPAASYGVSKTPRNEARFEEYDPERFKK